MKTYAIDVLLALSVLITLLSVVGMLRVRDPYQRMHYISPPASVSALLIAAAIFIQRGWKSESFKAALTALILIGMNSAVTHAAARGFRVAEVKDWRPRKGEEVPILPQDESVKTEKAA